jgi:hypothetical protein
MSEDKYKQAVEQARAQLSSIIEMVADLDHETAARRKVESMERDEVIALLRENHEDEADWPEGEDTEDLMEELTTEVVDGNITIPDWEWDEDEARRAIGEDPLSVEVRIGWHSPGESPEPDEYCILLCTGGPAVRIVGDLDRGEPSSARLECQDWYIPWTEAPLDSEECEALLTYARCFYFGN